ncbi:RNA 3'-terminal phosphate cyclase [Candidatus Nitrosarchaeum limnium]|jgi:RNA 3'-terminal phosphate cyclase (ATP)|uniref:RNA 3'-terminal phosphate cyclase n=1 Tax=Candidatus Nitrosarchaeum limnium BG20 TaxID=859192 RepID=S2E7S6_9ARCH|nr:RNA 3'-terminal phosphate cyclase [Candidatus Nitrosarchaeum limnium]EPA06783.1 RNA 3'-phosphate cyclase [Candidatus Nitrosarchaeum limnium BG20]
MNFLRIDGEFGEGGGQIIRTAITLSCITKKPIMIENIRKNRKIPGLKAQHLTAIKILQKICNAEVEGAKIGSTSLKFTPGNVKSCNLIEDVGTAGSISLISQVLIPAVGICKEKLNLTIKGGTDALWSPTIDYTQYVLREAYSRMGINFSIKLIKRGYYPKGGGQIELSVEPSNVNAISLIERKTKNVNLICSFSNLPSELIKKNIEGIVKQLTEKKFIVKSQINEENTIDSGATLLIFSADQESIIGIDSIFDKKTERFNLELQSFMENNLGVDERLADMLVLPASLANKITIFRVGNISKHLETNLFVTSKITGCKYGVGKLSNGFEVRIEGVSNTSIK